MSKHHFILVLFLTACSGSESKDLQEIGSDDALPTIKCPEAYVVVYGDKNLGTNHFCVMRFEAKNIELTATSQASAKPWTERTSSSAFAFCNSLNDTGLQDGFYALISNPEWMTIARNIESVDANWSGNAVGQGHIARGHTDGLPAESLEVSDVEDPYSGTQNNSSEGLEDWAQRRTHTLTSGGVIWDFSGNVSEWVDWHTEDTEITSGPSNGEGEFHDFPNLGNSSLKPIDVLPLGNYNANQHSVGRLRVASDGSKGRAQRGGSWSDKDTLLYGPFALSMNNDAQTLSPQTGFRCVYRPD